MMRERERLLRESERFITACHSRFMTVTSLMSSRTMEYTRQEKTRSFKRSTCGRRVEVKRDTRRGVEESGVEEEVEGGVEVQVQVVLSPRLKNSNPSSLSLELEEDSEGPDFKVDLALVLSPRSAAAAASNSVPAS
eukprot:GILI01012294.1.p1 GENE.GILI01012294.1~~GILI01012294.1.p1  ORF type:complete len:136 (+),score=16.71 GILI01012294.1:249-656(+)